MHPTRSARFRDLDRAAKSRSIAQWSVHFESWQKEREQWKREGCLSFYARLVLPHVALVAVVCIYAIVGAYVFYSLESPHEDRLKNEGIQTIQRNRREILEIIWEKVEGKDIQKEAWMKRMSSSLQKFNVDLYRAYKEQYVRYGDVRMSKPDPLADPRVKRHRSSSKSRSETGGKLWTATSSLFFAATTMSTIGYGDLVPVTPHGRMACVIFALFGAPLAIITIGDLGKFLSECTIWLYKQMIDARRRFNGWWYRLRVKRKGGISELDAESGPSRRSSADHSKLYIAFGGVLFSFLESWSYMDAFYYSFVSLTTIGFGDLVPSMDNAQIVVLMLIYLGVGLAVTTMCIDLVGIQYIQKIHYFGRKFRGTDILQYLKSKRMIERHIAMGNTEEVMQLLHQHVVQEQQKEVPPIPRPILNLKTANEAWQNEQAETEGASIAAEDVESWHADETLVAEGQREAAQVEEEPLTSDALTEIMQQNTDTAQSAMVEGAEYRAEYIPRSPSPISNASANDRDLMYDNWDRGSARGSAESGPTISRRCSIQTTPSVDERERMYDNLSNRSSVTSFKFSFDGPWPDLREIAAQAKDARRIASCPADLERPVSPTLYSAIQDTYEFSSHSCTSLSSHVSRRLALRVPAIQRANSERDLNALVSAIRLVYSSSSSCCAPLLLSPLTVSAAVGSPLAAHLAARCEVESTLVALGFRDPPLIRMLLDLLVQQPDSGRVSTPAQTNRLKLEKQPQNRFFQQFVMTVRRRSAISAVISRFARMFAPSQASLISLPPAASGNIVTATNQTPIDGQPILRRKRLARLARRQDPLDGVGWLNVSPRALAVESVESPSGSSEVSQADEVDTPDSALTSLIGAAP
ncbi:hypothetical protein M3Y96_01079100 [Aphelenchoides besseyi]|nr:hypothetical protein M3Y96_01079100 [Aphelenchoides besseyi]